MYRLTGPNLILFVPIVLIGIIFCSITPNYFGASRILSLLSLLIGEAGMSFIPVLALFPKARPLQAILLALIYFFTTILICFAAWAINNFGFPGKYAFMWKDGEFNLNTYSLFVANLFSLISLILNFRLIYDEELTKEIQLRGTKNKYSQKSRFTGFQKPLLKRPEFKQNPGFSSAKKENYETKSKFKKDFEEDFGKPFEFEPETLISPESLPEESSGGLFAEKETKSKPTTSDFFDTEGPEEETSIKFTSGISTVKAPKVEIQEKPKPIQVSPFPPSSIKDDLAAIFEQYSSLDAVKKLTSGRSSKQTQYQKKTRHSKNKPYELPKEKESSQISVHIEGEDIHEASFRQISEQEKLQEIKEELKKELTPPPQESKEEIIQSIKTIKDELIESLKEEIKKEFTVEKPKEITKETTEEPEEEEKITEEEISDLQETLNKINKEPKVTGSFFINKNGELIVETWKEKPVLHKEVDKTISQVFNSLNNQINKTNQGSLSHILLESENGTMVLANIYNDNKILTVSTTGTTPSDSGQILRVLSEIE